MAKVIVEKQGPVCTVIINRPEVRNAVDRETARLLYDAFVEFDGDETLSVAVLWGTGGHFCAGADLRAVAGGMEQANELNEDMNAVAPMGPSRLLLSKPVIAAVSGYAVAGGLELACWCDLRMVEKSAVFGVFCRRFGVPLIDGGTQRLPRLIGQSRALDMILTGRPVGAEESLSMGLANRLVDDGESRAEAEELARQLAELPQICLRSDRLALYEGTDLEMGQAMELEFQYGLKVIRSGETVAGAKAFKDGKGKHGRF